ncbi:MAG: LLM class flavin-dependent oxidoreductase [Chloroflexi bacterium]|nr:LLM class flavin-dependent oxidoreductase [Chloroflexota bacterium]
MSIRIGLVNALWPYEKEDPALLYECVQRCEALGLDSLWFTDSRMQPRLTLEPVVAMMAAAARTKRLKFGTAVMVLPTRSPVVLARELATLDFLAGGRTILGIGIGGPHGLPEGVLQGYGLGSQREAAGRADEMIVLLRKLWTEREVKYDGKYYHVGGMQVFPKPVQQPSIPIWVGGKSEGALRRAGRLGDGWFPTASTPEECRQGKQKVIQYAKQFGRTIPDDHYGAYLSFSIAGSREEAERRASAKSSPTNAVGDPDQVRAKVKEYISAGISKFTMVPMGPGKEFFGQLDLLAKEVVAPLQTPAGK